MGPAVGPTVSLGRGLAGMTLRFLTPQDSSLEPQLCAGNLLDAGAAYSQSRTKAHQ